MVVIAGLHDHLLFWPWTGGFLCIARRGRGESEVQKPAMSLAFPFVPSPLVKPVPLSHPNNVSEFCAEGHNHETEVIGHLNQVCRLSPLVEAVMNEHIKGFSSSSLHSKHLGPEFN